MRQPMISVPVEKQAYVGYNPTTNEWMLFRTWTAALAAEGYQALFPARASDVYFAKLAGKVTPVEVARASFRRKVDV